MDRVGALAHLQGNPAGARPRGSPGSRRGCRPSLRRVRRSRRSPSAARADWLETISDTWPAPTARGETRTTSSWTAAVIVTGGAGRGEVRARVGAAAPATATKTTLDQHTRRTTDELTGRANASAVAPSDPGRMLGVHARAAPRIRGVHRPRHRDQRSRRRALRADRGRVGARRRRRAARRARARWSASRSRSGATSSASPASRRTWSTRRPRPRTCCPSSPTHLRNRVLVAHNARFDVRVLGRPSHAPPSSGRTRR